jgi:hypothetical protein
VKATLDAILECYGVEVDCRPDIATRQCDALIEALKRYDYTEVGSNIVDGRYVDRMYAASIKPYFAFIDEGGLIIVHRWCTDCLDLYDRAHTKQFLKELIPVIGRSDGKAEYIERSGCSPRLKISV